MQMVYIQTILLKLTRARSVQRNAAKVLRLPPFRFIMGLYLTGKGCIPLPCWRSNCISSDIDGGFHAFPFHAHW